MRELARKCLWIGLLALFGLAGYWSARLAWADQLSRSTDRSAVERAVRFSPGNADFRIRLARTLQSAGGDPTSALQAASALNPTDAAVWMRLGLAAEMRGDLAGAEHYLLEATRVSRQFEPRWTLANYYFRRGAATHFWPTATQALLAGYGDLSPMFDLCWKMSQDDAFLAAHVIPEKRSVLDSYLGFLMRENRLRAAAEIAGRIAAQATEADRPALLAWCDRLLQEGEAGGALETWNALCGRRLLPYAALDPAHGVSLTDGSFAADTNGSGFAWRLESGPGVLCSRNQSPSYVWVSFSGRQNDSCEPLSQYLPLAPGAHYRLRYQYRTSDMAAESGLRWQFRNAADGAPLASQSPWLSSPQWKDDEALFTAPAAVPLVRLALSYQRSPGATRIEGSVLLRNVSLERLP